MKKISKKARRIVTLLMALCMMFMMSLPVLATDKGDSTTSVSEDPRESILKIITYYENDGGETVYWQTGTGFLINDEYVLTNRHVVTLDDETKKSIKDSQGLSELKDDDEHIKIEILVNRDMTIPATIHTSVQSSDMDFAAVKLSEKIYDRSPVALGDSSKIATKDPVYAMGFPVDSIATKDYNTKDDVSTVNGIISKITVQSVDIIEHTAPLNNGNSGGPLLNENNEVIGINTFVADKKNYSIQINVIKQALDTFGIPYTDASTGSIKDTGKTEGTTGEETTDEETKEVTEPDNSALFAELQSEIDSAKAVDTASYTEESVTALNDEIGTAEAVVKNTEAEAATIQTTIDDLKSAVTGLEEKTGPNMLLIGGIAALVIIVIIIVIVVIAMSGKKNKKAAYVPAGARDAVNNIPVGNQTSNNVSPVYPETVPQQPEGTGETTVLDAGAGETTLLGASGAAYLIRKKNGEKIAINVQNFKIGKERKKVNYCISDNTSVSRCHVEIVKKGADYYVVDQGATNFTFVNGVQLSPHQETLLSDQSSLKLSDEEFEFHLS
ncbi:MAG: trypsin-like peptidase domain-containing protein [Hespellia sp.]|nr:trypsin-like peptidase domain-containing protein [Hespellia sp.]